MPPPIILTISEFQFVSDLILLSGGIVMTHLMLSFVYFIKHFLSERSISLTHIVYVIISPIVLWQFIFFCEQFLSNKNCCGNLNPFFFGILVLFTFGILLMLAQTLLPINSINLIQEDKHNLSDFFKLNRRYFYLYLITYVFLLFLISYLINADNLLINLIRLILIITNFNALVMYYFIKNKQIIKKRIYKFNYFSISREVYELKYNFKFDKDQDNFMVTKKYAKLDQKLMLINCFGFALITIIRTNPSIYFKINECGNSIIPFLNIHF